jgi:hypothetical protein
MNPEPSGDSQNRVDSPPQKSDILVEKQAKTTIEQ